MASEVKVDTISEKTSGSGVTIDGLLIKDGGISGDVALIGTTPTFTIGDGGAEDAALVFDGNAQDFHIGLDDTADDLVIGVGSALGTTTCISITDGRAVTVGEAGIASSISGITFFQGDTGSIYTHDVSGTDNTATYNTAYGLTALDAITDGDNNTVIGYGAAGASTTLQGNVVIGTNAVLTGVFTGNNNVVIGKLAGEDLTSADGNIIIGEDAGKQQTTADNNVLIGQGAGEAITTGGNNIFMGTSAGDGHDAETYNIGIGKAALGGSINGGEYNVAIGTNTLDALTSADNCVAIGHEAGTAVTTGSENTLIGYNSGKALTTGTRITLVGRSTMYGNGDTENDNIGIGYVALGGSIAGGEYNVAIGNYALENITSCDNVVAIGHEAGQAITSHNSDVLIGYQAGKALSTGDDGVIAIGYQAGLALTTCSSSVFIGYQAGDAHDTEDHNIGIGRHALGGSVAGGEYNVAVGNYSLDAITSGDNCTAVGYNALTAVQAGTDNIGFGSNAGDTINGGSANICIGSGSDVTDGAGDFATALGYQVIGTAGYTTIGDRTDDIRAAHGNTTWATVSDERFKKNIETSDAGLAVINDLRPVTFNWKTKGEIPEWSKAYEKDSTEQYRNATHNHGFIAQEVKAVIESHSELKDGFSMWDEKSDGQQEIGETAIVPILVKAVQELSAEIKALKQKIGE